MAFALTKRHHRLDDIGIGAVGGVGLRRDQGGDIAGGLVLQQGGAGQGQARIGEGHVALKVDDGVMAAVGIDGVQGGADAVGAAGQVRIGQDGEPAGRLNGVDDLPIARSDGHGQAGQHGLTPGPHNHRGPADIGEGLVRKAGGGHPGGDQDQRVHIQIPKSMPATLRPS